MYVWLSVYVCECMSARVCVRARTCMSVHVCVCTCACVHACEAQGKDLMAKKKESWI